MKFIMHGRKEKLRNPTLRKSWFFGNFSNSALEISFESANVIFEGIVIECNKESWVSTCWLSSYLMAGTSCLGSCYFPGVHYGAQRNSPTQHMTAAACPQSKRIAGQTLAAIAAKTSMRKRCIQPWADLSTSQTRTSLRIIIVRPLQFGTSNILRFHLFCH